jgi:hypothetical protein
MNFPPIRRKNLVVGYSLKQTLSKDCFQWLCNQFWRTWLVSTYNGIGRDLEITKGWFTQSPKSSQVWHGCMPTWPYFLEVRLATCVESWVEEKARPNSQHKSREFFLHKLIKIQLWIMNRNHILMVFWVSKVGTLPPCWDLLTWVGLGTWDPM